MSLEDAATMDATAIPETMLFRIVLSESFTVEIFP